MVGIKPLLWLTMLGRDGYWPVVGIRESATSTTDPNEPILLIPSSPTSPSSLQEARGQLPSKVPNEMHVTPAWTIAYFLAALFLTGHVILSAFSFNPG